MNRELLRSKLNERYGLMMNEHQVEVLIHHLEHVLEWNKKVNLTAIEDIDDAMILHIEDSLTAANHVLQAKEGEVVDLGSGGGFPGIPLAVVTGRKTTLVEAREKKIRIIDEFIETQGLTDSVRALPVRAEELALIENEKYSVVTARALSSLPSIMELATPLLQMNGVLIAYKGKPEEDEIEKARALEKVLGLQIKKVEDITLSDNVTHRSLLIIEKTGRAKIKLPRRAGMAQKKPLV